MKPPLAFVRGGTFLYCELFNTHLDFEGYVINHRSGFCFILLISFDDYLFRGLIRGNLSNLLIGSLERILD